MISTCQTSLLDTIPVTSKACGIEGFLTKKVKKVNQEFALDGGGGVLKIGVVNVFFLIFFGCKFQTLLTSFGKVVKAKT